MTVIDTPGIMDTAPVTTMEKVIEKARSVTGLYPEKAALSLCLIIRENILLV